ncbi:MAG: GNAT family N-acetyltransferase [Telmatospirillum sp.]|nr:GNAT family N-acetyltransferase [Telmatospirillum sp.]
MNLTVLLNQPGASQAYADAMESATADILIFAHCDVFFPEGWFERFEWEIERLTRLDPNWAVAGVIGVTAGGNFVGRVWDCSLAPLFAETGGLFGTALKEPVQVVSFDELVLIVRRDAGVHFDRKLPGFHLYGSDIALEAERRGRTTYALDIPLIHNAKAQLHVGPDYVEAYRYMVRKWGKRLPTPTTCGVLTTNPFVLPYRRMKVRYKALFRQSTYSTARLADPSLKASELGISRLLIIPPEQALPMTQSDDARKPGDTAESVLPKSERAVSEGIQFRAQADNSGPYRIQTLRSREEIEPFREFWNACAPGRDSDLDFYLFVTEHIDGCLRPHVFVLLEGETPRALLAGRIDIAKIPIKAGYFALPVNELKVLRIVHGGALGELNSERARLLVASMIGSLSAGEADAAMFESVTVNSPLAECARALPSRFCSDWLSEAIPHRMWDMSDAVGPFQSQLSSNARYQQRKRAAKLKSSFGNVRIEGFHSPGDLPKLMTSAETIAEKSYQRGIGVGFLRTPFVEARLAFEARMGWLRGFVLYLDNQPCAFWIGSLRNGAFVSNYLAFDPTYSDYSPGMYLLLIAMEEIWADGSAVRLFDFGGGDAPYKERLANVCIEETQIYIFAPRLKPLAINALRSTIGAVSHSIKRSETLAPQLQKLKRWLRSRAAKRA